jgi:hypothetical protein
MIDSDLLILSINHSKAEDFQFNSLIIYNYENFLAAEKSSR